MDSKEKFSTSLASKGEDDLPTKFCLVNSTFHEEAAHRRHHQVIRVTHHHRKAMNKVTASTIVRQLIQILLMQMQ